MSAKQAIERRLVNESREPWLPVLDEKVPAFDVAQIAESLTHGRDLAAIPGQGGHSEKPHARHRSRRRLSVGGERDAHEHHDGDEEPEAPHRLASPRLRWTV